MLRHLPEPEPEYNSNAPFAAPAILPAAAEIASGAAPIPAGTAPAIVSDAAAEMSAATNAQANITQTPLITALRKQAAAQRRVTRIFQLLWAGFGVTTAALFIGMELTERKSPFHLFSLAMMGQSVAIAVTTTARKKWQATLEQMLQEADLQVVGPLIEMFQYRHDRLFAGKALPALLNRLTAADAPLLTAQSRAILNQFLGSSPASLNWQTSGSIVAPMMKAILRAYEQVGDSGAIPVVERLANGEGYAKEAPWVRRAAQECLPFLRERGPNETLRQNLLRAASSPPAAPETLLRPASATAETAPQELLRSVPGAVPPA